MRHVFPGFEKQLVQALILDSQGADKEASFLPRNSFPAPTQGGEVEVYIKEQIDWCC